MIRIAVVALSLAAAPAHAQFVWCFGDSKEVCELKKIQDEIRQLREAQAQERMDRSMDRLLDDAVRPRPRSSYDPGRADIERRLEDLEYQRSQDRLFGTQRY